MPATLFPAAPDIQRMSQKIIEDMESLQPSYLPKKLIFREKEYSELLANLRNSINSLLYGPIASGKTALLKKAALETNSNRIRAIYIDCSLYKTANAILREILIDRPIASRSNYDLLKRLAERARNNRFAVCLDHVEDLDEKEIIGQLMGIGICAILACDSHEWFLTLDPRTRTSIAATIELKAYSVEQALQIAKARVEQALLPGTYSEDTIREIVEKTKANIPTTLNVLAAAALKAENQDKKSIDEIQLNGILPEHDCPEGLNADEGVILRILEESKSLPASRLRGFYTEKSRYPKSERAFRNYMENLCSKGLVKALGVNRGRTYEIVEDEPGG